MKSRKTIGYGEALQALLSSFEERMDWGALNPDTNDYFYGCVDRWSMAIGELSRNPGKGPVLDIGAHEGFLCRALVKLGYSVFALDLHSPIDESVWEKLGVEWHQCQIEADPIPFPDGYFTGVYMGQLLEHFTYSPRKPFQEIRRVLKPGGLLVVDVPNAGEWHNFYRLIRGKNILWDYKRHYIDYEPSFYKGLPYFDRHNHEFTPNELRALAESCQFEAERVAYIRSRRFGKKGLRRLETPFTGLRDLIPIFRKGIMLTARKELMPS
jgi:SAM-dependent methyltransferase